MGASILLPGIRKRALKNKTTTGEKNVVAFFRRLGLVTMVGVFIAVLGGVLAKYSHNLRSFVKPINMKLYHATGGMIIFILAMVTAALASYSNWFHNRMGKSPWVGRLCMWAPIILAICVARQVTQSYLPRILEPRESAVDTKAKIVQAKVDAKLKKDKPRKDDITKIKSL